MSMLRSALFWSCVIGVMGCSPELLAASEESLPEAPVVKAESKEALIIQPDVVFPKRTLRVCFRTPSITTAQRNVVRNAAHEWEKATGLRFVGFGNCTAPFVTDAEIGIIQDELFYPHGTGGQPYAAMSLRFTYAIEGGGCASSPDATEMCLMNTAIHEFGHVLGFAHEQNRTDGAPLSTMNSDNCQATDGTYGFGIEHHGPWDLFGVMNYCNPNGDKVDEFAPLSESDKSGAATRYGRPLVFADLNGDGLADAVSVNQDTIVARFSNGNSFVASRSTFSTTPFFGKLGTYFADVTGDLKADAIAVSDTTVIVRRSDGSSFGPAELWLSVPSGTPGVYGRNGVFFADVTGDGRADHVIADENQVVVRRSLAPGAFGSPEVWLSGSAFPLDTEYRINTPSCGTPPCAWRHIPFSFMIKLANVTSGDSRADLILFTEGGRTSAAGPNGGVGVRVFTSTGSSFNPVAQVSPGFFGNRATAVADIDGDGRTDLVASTEAGLSGVSGRLRTRLSTLAADGGTNFSNTLTNVSTDEFFGARGTHFANIDGVAGDEAIAVNDNNILVRRKNVGGPLSYGPPEVWAGPFYPGSRLTLTGSVAAVWRTDDFSWSAFKTSSADELLEQWGAANDRLVPGDYDRDGFVDLAVWRPSTGTWHILKSSSRDNGTMSQQWGQDGDIPVPDDYDGDGYIDFAVWRPSEGNWYVLQSTTGTLGPVRQFGSGEMGDIPLPGRYDNDNRADPAVWRPRVRAEFFWTFSTTGATNGYFQWGTNGADTGSPSDIPVPSDYNGDGRTDIAVWRPGDGFWFVRDLVWGINSSQQFGQGAQPGAGLVSDIPVPGRYHSGDNRTDFAVYRPNFGEFHIRHTQTGALSFNVWGRTQDIPIPRKW